MDEKKVLEKLQVMAEGICDCYCIHPKTILIESEMEAACEECPLNDYVRWITEQVKPEDTQGQKRWKENFMERFCKVN